MNPQTIFLSTDPEFATEGAFRFTQFTEENLQDALAIVAAASESYTTTLDESLAFTAGLTTGQATQSQRNPSFQPLGEAAQITGTLNLNNREILSGQTINSFVQDEIQPRLENLKELNADLNDKPLKQAGDEIVRQNNVLGQSLTQETANGNFTISASNGINFLSNRLNLNSDTAASLTAPQTRVLSQNHVVQANNSAILLSDSQITKTQSAVEITDEKATQTTNSVLVSTNRAANISAHQTIAGTITTDLLGGTTNIAGDSLLNVQSGGLHVESNSNKLQLTEEASLVVAQGNSAVHAVITGGEQTTIYGSSSQGFALAGQSNVQLATDLSVNVAGSTAVNFANATYVSGTSGYATLTTGNSLLLGTVSIPSLTPPTIRISAPPRLSIPRLPTASLAACIPRGLNQRNRNQRNTPAPIPGTFTGDPSELSNVGLPDDIDISDSSTFSDRLPPELFTGSNTAITNPRFGDYSLARNLEDRLPPPASTDKATNNNQVSPVGANFMTDIYLRRLQSEKGLALANLLEDTTPEDLDSYRVFIDPSELTATFRAIDLPEGLAEDLGTLINNNIQGLNENLETFFSGETQTYTFLSQEDREFLEEVFNLYPSSLEAAGDAISQLNQRVAIGFFSLSSISSIFSLSSQAVRAVSNFVNPDESSYVGDANNQAGIHLNRQQVNALYEISAPYINRSLFQSELSPYVNPNQLINLGSSIILNEDTIGVQTLEVVEDALSRKLAEIVTGEGALYAGALPDLRRLISEVAFGAAPIDALFVTRSISNILQRTVAGDLLREGLNVANTAGRIYQGLEGLLEEVNRGNLLSVVQSNDLSSIVNSLGLIIGRQNAAFIQRGVRAVEAGIRTFQALREIPQVLSLLDDFNISAIEQVALALNCVDLFDRLQDLFNEVSGLFPNRRDSYDLGNNLPRTLQLINTLPLLTEADRNQINLNLEAEEEITLPQFIEEIETSILPAIQSLSLNACFRLPTLTLAEAEVNPIEITPGGILLFSMPQIALLYRDLSLLPAINDRIRLEIDRYTDENNQRVTPFQTDGDYTPNGFNFIVTEFDVTRNLGLAVISRERPTLVVQDISTRLFEYDVSQIGAALTPNIIDAYLVK